MGFLFAKWNSSNNTDLQIDQFHIPFWCSDMVLDFWAFLCFYSHDNCNEFSIKLTKALLKSLWSFFSFFFYLIPVAKTVNKHMRPTRYSEWTTIMYSNKTYINFNELLNELELPQLLFRVSLPAPTTSRLLWNRFIWFRSYHPLYVLLNKQNKDKSHSKIKKDFSKKKIRSNSNASFNFYVLNSGIYRVQRWN